VETLVVSRSTGKTLLWLVISVGLIPLAGAYALGVFTDVDFPGQLLGWAGVLAGGYGIVRFARQLRQTGPIIEIGPAGFHDHRLSAGPIPWAHITSFTLDEKKSQVVVAMPDGAVQHYVKPGLGRSLNRLNSGLIFNTVGLSHSITEVYEAIQHWHAPRPA
jgi:hypothetical protein